MKETVEIIATTKRTVQYAQEKRTVEVTGTL